MQYINPYLRKRYVHISSYFTTRTDNYIVIRRLAYLPISEMMYVLLLRIPVYLPEMPL